MNMEWKPITDEIKDGGTYIVATLNGMTIIPRIAHYDNGDYDIENVGWWSYENSVAQIMIEPAAWLCKCPDSSADHEANFEAFRRHIF